MKTSMYYWAEAVAFGLKGMFDTGPLMVFDSAYMDRELIPFKVTEGGQPKLAMDDLIAHAASISEDMHQLLEQEYLALTSDCELLGKTFGARGEEVLMQLQHVLAASPHRDRDKTGDAPTV